MTHRHAITTTTDAPGAQDESAKRIAELEAENAALKSDILSIYRQVLDLHLAADAKFSSENAKLASFALHGLWAYADKSAGAEAENVRLREALEKYADEENWHDFGPASMDSWKQVSRGFSLARAALESKP